jgi:uroporphyrinogen decarboxylase
MTSRERVLTALDHLEPDHCPVSFGSSICDGMTRAAKEKFDSYMGYTPADVKTRHHVMGMVETPPQIVDWIKGDFATAWMKTQWVEKGEEFEDGTYIDPFGCTLRPINNYYDVVKRPLSGSITAEKIKKHKWPNPYDPDRTDGLLEAALAAKDTGKAVLLDIPAIGPFEGGCWVRGFEDFLCDLYDDEYLAETLMDAITENTIGFWDAALSKIGHLVDVCGQGDDVAMQDRPFVSPEVYDRLIKKYHKRIYDFIKSKTKARIFQHICGSAFDLLPYMIEAGVDILEAVQTSAAKMDPVALKKEFGNDLCFWGAIDTQKLIMQASPKEFKTEIFKLVEILGRDGGFVLAPSHNIQPNVPMENLKAMFDAFAEIRGN